MKKILLSLIITFAAISVSFGANKIDTLDAPIFWQPDAIKESLEAFNATETQFSEFINIYYDKTETAYGTQRISAMDIFYIWLNVFAEPDENGKISDEQITKAQNFIFYLITKHNDIIAKLEKEISNSSENNSDIITTEKAEEIYKNTMELVCAPNKISQFSFYKTSPQTKETKVTCNPISSEGSNMFSCILERVFATGTKDTICTMACSQVKFERATSGYNMRTINCSGQMVTQK